MRMNVHVPTAVVVTVGAVLIGYRVLAQPAPVEVTPPAAPDVANVDEGRELTVVIPQAPPTKLEAFERRPGVRVVRSFAVVGTVQAETGTIEVSAVVMKEPTGKATARGISVRVTSTRTSTTASAYIDEEEIVPLLEELGTLPKLNREDAPLGNFDARYATSGHFEIVNIESNGARYALIRAIRIAPITGEVTRATARLRIARLADLRQQLVAAKEQLDKVKR